MKPTVIFMLFLWRLVEFTSTLKECSKLPSVQHAFVLDEYKKAEYQEGDVIYFCCDPGFTTGLNTTYICTEHGWRAATIGQCIDDSFPVLLGCTPPPPVTNGYVLQNTTLMFGNGQIARYQCDSLYTLSGGSYKICNNGQWTGDIQCTAITCKVESSPPMSTIYHPQNQSIFTPGQTVRVTCGDNEWVKNSTLQTAQLVCQDTGNWDFPPVCQQVKCPKFDQRVYRWESYWRNSANIDESLFYQCNPNYEATSRRATCTRQGWEPKPLCKEISCPKPELNHFQVEGEKEVYKEREVLRYTCVYGYKKTDGRPSLCLKQGQTAQWTPTPQCELITCKVDSYPPMGTTYDPQDQNIFTPGQTVRVTCGDNEWVKNSKLQTAQLMCQETGNWDFPPVCQQVKCPKFDQRVYRWESYWRNSANIDESLFYQCNPNYEATSRRATCTRQGWEPKPLCKEQP